MTKCVDFLIAIVGSYHVLVYNVEKKEKKNIMVVLILWKQICAWKFIYADGIRLGSEMIFSWTVLVKFKMESGKTNKRKVTYQPKLISFKFSIVFANNQILIKNHTFIFAYLICLNVKRIENMLSFLNFDL